MSAASPGATTRRAADRAARTPQRPAVQARPRLRVVPSPRQAPRRAPFVALVLTLLVVGLGGLLVLNTVLAQGAFRVEALQRQVSLLTDDEEALQQQVARLAAPSRLARQARALGMVPTANPAFLRSADGAVLGRARPAVGVVPQWARPVAPARRPSATAANGAPADAAPAAGDRDPTADGNRDADRPKRQETGR